MSLLYSATSLGYVTQTITTLAQLSPLRIWSMQNCHQFVLVETHDSIEHLHKRFPNYAYKRLPQHGIIIILNNLTTRTEEGHKKDNNS